MIYVSTYGIKFPLNFLVSFKAHFIIYGAAILFRNYEARLNGYVVHMRCRGDDLEVKQKDLLVKL